MAVGFPFEEPIIELEAEIEKLKAMEERDNLDLSDEIKRLTRKCDKLKKDIFNRLTPHQRVQVARHPMRPYTLDYIRLMMDDFVELHGDRLFADDAAIVGGLATFEGRTVVVIGHQKGRSTNENIRRNFGMPNPEGYRKALRLMKMAEKFDKPVLSFIDTPGAYPGIGAEERGQGEAIARNLREMSRLRVPIIVIIIGEGASGGALGIGVGDRILMLENAWYSVISPEGCASILWKDATKAPEAAATMKLTAQDLLKLGVIDEIIKEPLGGAHRNHEEVARTVKEAISRHLKELEALSETDLVEGRYKKFRCMGAFIER
ncbi:MAG: acetyl-CoA carboxylase carboxyltransferase subunit alpha [bacterium]